MKKCFNCNKVFDDKCQFCPECGGTLLSKDTCPKCGMKVAPVNKFCPGCGKKINRINICEKCGEVQREESDQFCPKCGTKYQDIGYIGTKYSSHRKSESNPSTSRIVSIAVSIAFILAFIIGFIGFFGNVYVGRISDGITSLDITKVSFTHFFGDGAKQLQSIKASYQYPEYYYLLVAEFILHSTFYFAGFILTIVVGIIGIINLVKVAKNEACFNPKLLVYLICAFVPYLAYTQLIYGGSLFSSGATLLVTYGWGTILIVIASLISVATFGFYKIMQSIQNNENTLHHILNSIGLLVCVLIAVFFVTSIGRITDGSGNFNIPNTTQLHFLLSNYSSGTTDHLGFDFQGMLYGLLFMIALIILFYEMILTYTFKSSLLKIIFSSLGLIIYVIGTCLYFRGFNLAYSGSDGIYTGMSAFTIFGYILFAILICINSSTLVIKSNE